MSDPIQIIVKMVEIMFPSLSSSPDLTKRKLEESEELKNQISYFVRRPNYDICIATNTSVLDQGALIHTRLHGVGPYVAWRHKHLRDKFILRDNIIGDRNIVNKMTC